MRRLATVVTTLALSVSGMVFSPAQANVPVDGSYSCASGVKDGPTPSYTIAAGSVTAFSGTSCTGAVAIPEGLTSIGDEAFKNATGLTSITIPASVTSIGGGAFDGSGVQTVAIAANSQMTSIGSYAFIAASSLSYIAIPSSVTSIGGAAFMYTDSLSSITIPSSVTSIGMYAFHESGLTSITIPANVTSIGGQAFWQSRALASVIFLGDTEPTVSSQAFTELASSAKAIIKSGATGFTAEGSPLRWNGLEVVRNSADVAAAAAEHARIDADQVAELARIQAAAAAELARIAAAAEQARIAAAAAAAAEQARIAAAAAAAAEQARIAAAAAAELASRTVPAKTTYTANTLAQRTGVQVVSPKAKVTLAIASGSKKVCTKSGSKIKTVAAGNCVLTLTVQEPTPSAQKISKSLVVGGADSSSSWKAKNNYSISAVASSSDVSRSSSAKLSMTVSKSSKGICAKSGSNLKMLKAGTCNVTFTVQEPKPAATKTTKTFVVN